MTVDLPTVTSHVLSRLIKSIRPSVPTTRVAVTLIITAMVISSPIFIMINPVQVSAATNGNFNGADTSGYHSNMPMSETSSSTPTSTASQDGDFTSQAALSLTRASQTNNFVSSKAYYDISFRTATAGAIKSIVMDFPPGTSVGSALLVEATGIGPGTISASAGEVLTYTVTNAVTVPANTIIRIQISNINNPPTPSNSLTVSITTRNATSPIDGPTPTTAFNMVQVGNAQIAPGAVTTTKIATGAVTTGDIAKSLGYQRALSDGQSGWNPDGADTVFAISDSLITTTNQRVIINLATPTVGGPVCSVTLIVVGAFELACSSPPAEATDLSYAVLNLPPA